MATEEVNVREEERQSENGIERRKCDKVLKRRKRRERRGEKTQIGLSGI